MGLLSGRHTRSKQWLKRMIFSFIFIGVNGEILAANEVAFVIDTSGSMIKNDPNNLRKPALKLATQMLPTGTKAGVWLFDSKANVIVPFDVVNQEWKNKTTKAISKVNSKGQFTNIENALSASSSIFSDDADSKSIILLTDGQVDISKNQQSSSESRERILTQLLPQFQNEKIQIHTIALSANADQDLLQRLSVGSNGMYSLAKTADDLVSIFLQAFDQSIAADQVPLENNAFTVDSSIHEFTVLVFRKPGSEPSRLISPSKQTLTQKQPGNSTWFSDSLYDLITVQSPEAGQWNLDAEVDPDNRVTIVSDLELNLRGLPNNIVQGQEVTLEFYLSDDDGIIAAPTLLSLLDIDFEQNILTDPPKVLRAKVTSHSQGAVRTPGNGIFSAKLSKTLITGEHEFSVFVDGKTFKRTQTKRARVFSQVMEQTIIPSETDSNTLQLNLVPISGLVKADSLEITGSIKGPNGQIAPSTLTPTKFGSWVLSVPPSQGKTVYKAFITVKGQTTDGDDFEIIQGPMMVDYTQPLSAQQSQPQELFAALDKGNNEQEIAAFKQSQEPTPAPAVQTEPEPKLASETKPVQSEATEAEPKPEEEPHDDLLADTPEDTLDSDLLDDSAEDDLSADPSAEDPVVDPESSASDSSMNKWLLYGGIALANIILIGGGIYFGRRWIKRKKAEAEAEDKALLDAVQDAKAKASEKIQPKAPPQPEEKAPETEEGDKLASEAAKISDMLDSIDDQDEPGTGSS